MPSLVTKIRVTSAWCVMACGLLFLMPVTAAAVQILVTDQNGTPIPLVHLCISTPDFSVQKMTDQNGRYNFSLPLGTAATGPATVRTSRNGFANNQATISMTATWVIPESTQSPGSSRLLRLKAFSRAESDGAAGRRANESQQATVIYRGRPCAER